MDRFEYFCECFSKPNEEATTTSIQAMTAELNKMGQDGWELVQSSGKSIGDNTYIWRTWKRKVQ